MRNIRQSERGFNLIEVMVALAILGSVLLSIITLFFLGRNNVYSGKQMTKVTAAVVHANEDIAALYPRDLFNAFAIDPTTTTSSHTVAGVTYPTSLVYTTAQAGSTVDPKGYLTRWAALIPASSLSKAKISLVLIPLDLTTSSDVTTARVIQTRIVAEWSEGVRNRNMILDSTKLNR